MQVLPTSPTSHYSVIRYPGFFPMELLHEKCRSSVNIDLLSEQNSQAVGFQSGASLHFAEEPCPLSWKVNELETILSSSMTFIVHLP